LLYALLPSLAALLAGTLIAVQAGINAQLARAVGGPLGAATISFAVGLMALLVAGMIGRIGLPSLQVLKAVPPHLLITGGLLGAIFVFGSIVLAPRLGSGALVALVVTGQLLAALVLDQFGLAGFPEHALSPGRALGAVLLIAGVVLVRFF
jgi:transporter family-2 protein